MVGVSHSSQRRSHLFWPDLRGLETLRCQNCSLLPASLQMLPGPETLATGIQSFRGLRDRALPDTKKALALSHQRHANTQTVPPLTKELKGLSYNPQSCHLPHTD